MSTSEDVLAALVEGAAKGDRQATAELYRLMRRKFAFGTLQRLKNSNWEDVFHEAFIAVLEAVRRGDINKKASVLGFMKTVIERTEAREIGSLIRSRGMLDTDSIEKTYQARDSMLALAMRARENPERDVAHAEKERIMHEELAKLGPADQEILRRYYLNGEKIPAIQAAMNYTDNQFRLNKCRAKKKLQAAVAARLERVPARVEFEKAKVKITANLIVLRRKQRISERSRERRILQRLNQASVAA